MLGEEADEGNILMKFLIVINMKLGRVKHAL